MRKILIASGIAFVSLALVGSAGAQSGSNQTVEATIKPSKVGSKKKPKATSLSVTTTTTDADGSPPPVTARAKIQFPKQLKFNPKAFPACTLAVVSVDPETCPDDSIVGKGTAQGYAGGGPGATLVNLNVTAVNGPGGNTLFLFVRATGGTGVQGTLVGKLSRSNLLDVEIPQNLQSVAGLDTPLTKFQTTVKATTRSKGKTVNYVESTDCPSGGMPLSGDFILRDGGTLSAASRISCS